LALARPEENKNQCLSVINHWRAKKGRDTLALDPLLKALKAFLYPKICDKKKNDFLARKLFILSDPFQ
jgi:hypothetical protein